MMKPMATEQSMTGIKALTFVMFMMFAIQTDSVVIIIPEIVKTFRLSLTCSAIKELQSSRSLSSEAGLRRACDCARDTCR
jgi:fucose permease